MVLENSRTLKNLGIDIKPATKNVANTFTCEDIDGVTYFGAEIYEFRDIYLVYTTCIYACSEPELKTQLKNLYNCEYFMRRTLNNFCQWYQSFGKKLTNNEINSISKKFIG